MSSERFQSIPSGAFDLALGERDDRPAVLILSDRIDAGDLDAALSGAGLRLLNMVPTAQAIERLDIQIGCDILLLFCDMPGPLLERLLVQAETVAIQTGMAVVVASGLATIDLAYACIRNPRTLLLCEPDMTDIAVALIAAGNDRHAMATVHDIGREGESARLHQLSEEVSRLARTLELLTERQRIAAPSFDLGPRISDRPGDYIGMPALALVPVAVEPVAKPHGPTITSAQVRDMLRARRMRSDFLPGDLFADPAWDMLLDLLAARLDHDRVSVSSLCIAAAVPPTTALRWIRTLTDKGLVERQADPHDGRRIFIALAQDTADALTAWFASSRRFLCGG